MNDVLKGRYPHEKNWGGGAKTEKSRSAYSSELITLGLHVARLHSYSR